MGGVFTKVGNFFRSCWEGVKKFFKATVDLVIKGIKKAVVLLYEKNVLNIRTSGRGRDLYAWAIGAKEEMEKNGINPAGDFSQIIEDMKDNNQKKELIYKIESKDIKDPLHSENENETLKKLNNEYNLDLDYRTEYITISHFKSFDDGELSKFLSINFERIKNLDLSYNSITTVDPLKSFNNWFSLEKLNLSNNQINEIDKLSECDLPGLEELDISKNQIEFIDCLIDSKFENLKIVNISSNKINEAQQRYIKKLREHDVEIIE